MNKTFVELTNVIRRQRSEPEITDKVFPIASLNSQALLSDIMVGWCFIHGYAHLMLESQLLEMPGDKQKSLRMETAKRISKLIQKQ